MGAVSVSNECIDGTQQSIITATNGNTRIEIDGIETHELPVEPGTHVIVWYGPASHDPAIEIVWNTTTVEIETLDCTITTTSQAAPTTTVEATTSTVASTLPPASVPPTTWAIDIPQEAETTIAVTGSTLPATGSESVLAPFGFGFITIGACILWFVRRRVA